jgi:hypothetical protein
MGDRVARSAAFFGLCIATHLAGPPTAAAAHEWRAAWASPHAFEQVEALVSAPAESVRAEVSVARPFGLRELSCVHALGRWDPWEIHVGELSGPGYREWHVGLGRASRLGSPASLLLGARLFGVQAAGEALPARVAVTAILRIAPVGWRGPVLDAGVVDVGLARDPDQAAAVFLVRLRVAGSARRALLERSVTAGGGTETTFSFGYPLGRIRLAHAIRLTTGEGSLVVTLPAGPATVSVAERWHPALGWTPAVTVRWRKRD